MGDKSYREMYLINPQDYEQATNNSGSDLPTNKNSISNKYDRLLDTQITKQKLNKFDSLINALNSLNKKSYETIINKSIPLHKRVLLYREYTAKAYNITRKLRHMRANQRSALLDEGMYPPMHEQETEYDADSESEEDLDYDPDMVRAVLEDHEAEETAGAMGPPVHHAAAADDGDHRIPVHEDGTMDRQLHERDDEEGYVDAEESFTPSTPQNRFHFQREVKAQVPPTYQNNVIKLAERMTTIRKENVPSFNYDVRTGEIFLDGQRLPGTNVYAILTQMVRPKKKIVVPHQYEMIMKLYKKMDPTMKYAVIEKKKIQGQVTTPQKGSGSGSHRKPTFRWLIN